LQAYNEVGEAGVATVDTIKMRVHYYLEYNEGDDGGGLKASGQPVVDPEIMDGGPEVSGNAEWVLEMDGQADPAGTEAAGVTGHSFSKVISGGVEIAGAAEHTLDVADAIAPSGVEVSGEALDTLSDLVPVSGGTGVGGSADAFHAYFPEGGAELSGDAGNDSLVIMQGGVEVDGAVVPTGITNEPPNGIVTGTAQAGGTAPPSYISYLKYTTDGVGITTGGTFSGGITNVKLEASGAVYVSNVNDPVTPNIRFYISTEIPWNIRTFIFKDTTFFWSTGRLIVYWYRVIGEGRQGDECDLVADPCCQKYIVNVHARTLAELCEKLSDRRWTLPIQSVQKFARPAALGNSFADWEQQERLYQQYIDAHDNCDELIPIEICDVPQCADYCVDHDLRISFQFDVLRNSVNGIFEYISGNGDHAARRAYISGTAGVTYEKFLPHFDHQAEGEVGVEGEAVCYPNYFNASGGALIGGRAGMATNEWTYIGGDWPFYLNRTPTIIESVGTLQLDSTTQLTGTEEWVWSMDPDYNFEAQTDVSFLKQSEFLVLRGFNLGIPSDARVQRIEVDINRWTDQVSVQDIHFVLVYGDQIISNDLKQTGFRWPLIPTEIRYGDPPQRFEYNRLRFKSEEDVFGDPWNLEELNSPDFGVAIAIKEVSNITGAVGFVNSIGIEISYDFEGSFVATGGEARMRSTGWSYEATGEIEVGGTSDLVVDRTYIVKGIGLGQPTSCVIGGEYLLSRQYDVPDAMGWVDNETIDMDNDGQCGHCGFRSVGCHQPRTQ
jgi:hypothetical protein